MRATLRSIGLVAPLLAAAVAIYGCNGNGPVKPPLDPSKAAGTSQPAVGGASGAVAATRSDADLIGLKVIDPVKVGLSVQGVTALCDDNLKLAREILTQIKQLSPASPAALSWNATLGQLDNAFLSMDNASSFPYLVGVAHPDEAVRAAARACEKKTDELMTSVFLDDDLATVIKAYAKKKEQLSPERARFLKHTLRDFRRNGLELPADKRKRLRELNKALTEIGQKFIAEIGASVGQIEIKPERLAGLDDDYRKDHPPGKNGKVTITTNYPDYFPFVTYALDRRAATELYIKFTNRGGDANIGRLDRLFALRYEKAQLLGYDTWADYAIEPRMAKTAKEAIAFLGRVKKAIKPAVKKELREFFAEHVSLTGNTYKKMTPADRYFLNDRLKQKRYKLDSKKLAKYFEIEAVTKGLLDITAKMYGVRYEPLKTKTWHPDVKAFEVHSGHKKIARFYLDLHPRDQKYKHAAMFTIRSAKVLADGSKQTPVASLVCNFPRPGKPMQHQDVVTYFHEFGHVLHHILSETELASFSGTSTVRDFVETPSQMFEEWAWSRKVLNIFARHPKTGALIPDKLFAAMRKARKFGMALATERQVYLALLDLGYHARKPPFDTTKVLKQIHGANFSFPYVKGTHFQSSFGHLIGYDAGYYSYQWALALAHDVLSRFKKEGLLNPKPAADWRANVLSKGGSLDERGMIHKFLGREPSEKAYGDFLSQP